MTEHTPGPWSAIPSTPQEGFDCFWIEAGSCSNIGTVRGPQCIDAYQANARLIAAAPDLLAVVKGYEAWEAKLVLENKWEGPGGFPSLTEFDYDELMRLQQLRNLAIAKATVNGG
jgi:hypothetical protein